MTDVNFDLPVVIATIVAVFSLPGVAIVVHCRLAGRDKQAAAHSEELYASSIQNDVSDSATEQIFEREFSRSRTVSKHFTVWAWLWIIYYIVAWRVDISLTCSDGCDVAYAILNIVGYVELGVFVLFLYIETFLCWEWKYLWNIYQERICKLYLNQLRRDKPTIEMIVTAWHTEIRHRQVAETAADGTVRYRTEMYEEKVTDCIEREPFPYTCWVDETSDPDTLTLQPDKLTRIKLLETILFGDHQTETSFNEMRFKLESKVRNFYPASYISFERKDKIPGFKPRLTAYWGDTGTSCWANTCVFMLV